MYQVTFHRYKHTHTGVKSVCDSWFLFVVSQIESIQLMMDSETGRSKGYGFITVSSPSSSASRLLIKAGVRNVCLVLLAVRKQKKYSF